MLRLMSVGSQGFFAHFGLEGIVCKGKNAAYRSGARSGWIKVKTERWKAENEYRGKLFEKT